MTDVNDRWQSMSLATAGAASISNSETFKRTLETRKINDASDIAGAQPRYRSKEFLNKPDLHGTADIRGSAPKPIHRPHATRGSDPRFTSERAAGSKSKPKSTRHSDPLNPSYKLQSAEVVPFPEPKFLRPTNEISDIAGSRAKPRPQYAERDSYNVNDIDGAQADWRPPYSRRVHEGPPRDIMNCSDIIGEGFRTTRVNDVLNPVYRVNGFTIKDDEKSKPKPARKNRNAPDFSLTTTDISGAQPTINEKPSDLHTRNPNHVADIKGAVADTVKHGIRSNRRVDPICPNYHTLDGNKSAFVIVKDSKFVAPRQGKKEDKSDEYQVATKYDSDHEEYDAEDRVKTLALGSMMLTHSKAIKMMDSSLNRYAWNDPHGLQECFQDEEEPDQYLFSSLVPGPVARRIEK